ncbi:MAG: hypothetical protein PHT95_04395 [Candidatus Omnitrophica bacterium]|nr:hypothetical protein [Candidatus Omnitrophota bacterium]
MPGKKIRKSFTEYSRERIKRIHGLSSEYNGRGGKHTEKLLFLVREHAREITSLHAVRDGHFITETGDLLVLCLELILEEGADPDAVIELCYGRYHSKLKGLIDRRKSRNGRKKCQPAVRLPQDRKISRG